MECQRHGSGAFAKSGDFLVVAAKAGYVGLEPEEGEALVVEAEVGAWFGCSGGF